MVRLSGVFLAALVGCATAPEPGQESWSEPAGAVSADAFQSTDRTRFASAVLLPADGLAVGGSKATAVMRGMICGIHVDSGELLFDLQLPGARIEDSSDDPDLVLTSLAVQPPLVHLHPVLNPFAVSTYLVEGVRSARLLSDSDFVAVADDGAGCAVRWYQAGAIAGSVALPDDLTCDHGVDLAVDRLSGRAFVATPDRLVEASLTAPLRSSPGAERIAYDDRTDTLYAAQGDTVRASREGNILWERVLPGPVAGLQASQRELVVAWHDGPTSVVERRSPDGALIDTLDLPLSLTELAVSRSGDVLGVSGPHSQAYYRLR